MTQWPRSVFWVLVVAMIGVYVAMIGWSIPLIQTEAGGLIAFELRPAGYSHEEALGFLMALSDEGRSVYRGVQQYLDTAYPLLFGGVLFWATLRLTRNRGAWRFALAILPVLAMVFDLGENALVRELLRLPAESVSAELVQRASAVTVLKTVFTTFAYTSVLVLLGVWVWLSRRRRP